MTRHEHFLTAESAQPNAFPAALCGLGSSLRSMIAAWVATAADYYEAAAMYEQLSRLSDAELQRRGLSRATLAREVCAACQSHAQR